MTKSYAEKTFDEMLDLISWKLETSPKGKMAYTMLLGAGFSHGVIPTARNILVDAPVWLHKKRNGVDDDKKANNIEIAREFWANGKTKFENTDSSLEIDKDTGLPNDSSISEAYKFLMSHNCPNGLADPSLRREYIRDLCKNTDRKNNPAHLYLACLLSHQENDDWRYDAKFCKTILTTNFDPLLQDALQLVNVLYFMSDRPDVLDYLQEDDHEAIHLVYTHGSVHRYILLNSEDELEKGKSNSPALKPHFERHGVIVMGYGGGWDDATMEALQEANQFEGNLYWCVREGDTLPEKVKKLLKKHSACSFKVIIPDADEAMNKIFEKLTGMQIPKFMDDPIGLIIEQMDGLSFTETKKIECDSEETTSKADFSGNFNSQIEHSINRLRMAREVYQNPEKYDSTDYDEDQITKIDIPTERLEEIKAQAMASKYLAEALHLTEAEEFIPAIEMLSNVLGISGISSELKANALINRAITYGRLEPPKIEEKINDYTTVIGMSDASTEDKARALFGRGISYGNLIPPKIEEKIADYTKITEMPDVSAERKAKALHNRAITYGNLEPPKIEEKITDLTAIIEMRDVPAECKARSLCHRACTYDDLASAELGQKMIYYTAVIEDPDTLVGCKATALLNRAERYGELEPPKIEEAIADCTTIIEMPEASTKLKVYALCDRAKMYSKLIPPKTEEAIADYIAAIEMPEVAIEQKAVVLCERANAYFSSKPSKTKEAIADYTTVIEMSEAPTEQKGGAHGMLGLLHFVEHNDIQKLLEETCKALEYHDYYPWKYNLGLAKLFLGEPDEALKNCIPAIDECSDIGQIDGAISLLKSKEDILPEKSRAAYDNIMEKLRSERIKMLHR